MEKYVINLNIHDGELSYEYKTKIDLIANDYEISCDDIASCNHVGCDNCILNWEKSKKVYVKNRIVAEI